MNRKWNGYLTVEASLVMPIVLFLYLLIILSGFYLYNRCVISQDNYLLAFRGSRFTETGLNYGEVIYGDMSCKSSDKQYVEARLLYKSDFYPFYQTEEKTVSTGRNDVSVSTAGYKGSLKIKKTAECLNIIEIVEKVRSGGK